MANYEYRVYPSDWREEEYTDSSWSNYDNGIIGDLWSAIISFIFFVLIILFTCSRINKTGIKIITITLITYIALLVIQLIQLHDSTLYSLIENNSFWIVSFLDSIKLIEYAQSIPVIIFIILFFWYYLLELIFVIYLMLKNYLNKSKKK